MSATDTAEIAILTTTVASAEDASRLAAELVRERLAACVQVDALASHYVWQGQACNEAEWRLTCKTLPAAAARLSEWLRGRHPYELPQLLIHTARADAAYAQWVAGQVDP